MARNIARWFMGLTVCALILSVAWPAAGAVKTWDGAGSSSDWSDDGVGGNWSGDPAPVTTVDEVLFNDGGADATFGNITSVLDISPMSLTGLVFANTTGNTHTLDLNGNTLTVLGNVDVNVDLFGEATLAGITDTVGGGGLNIGDGTQAITIGQRNSSTSGNMSGTLDLTGMETVNIDVATITMSDSNMGAFVPTVAELNLGMTNTVGADTFYVGRRKSEATVDIVSGGTLNLGDSINRTDLLISYCDINTGFNGSGDFDLSAGVLNAFLDDLQIGVKTTGSSSGNTIGTFTMSDDAANSVDVNNVVLGDWDATGSGTASGAITMGGGTFDVNGNLVRGDTVGAGSSSSSAVSVYGGAMSVVGDFKVDTVFIGSNGGTGVITVGGDAQIGSGTEDLTIGFRNVNASGATHGTLDLSAATSVDINVATITLSDNSSNQIDPTTGTLHLGMTNTIAANTFYVGRRKGTGSVDIASGGTLDLGSGGARTDLLISYGDINTSFDASGDFDLSAGVLHAFLNDLKIGSKTDGTSNGDSIGTFTMSDDAGNSVDVNNVVLGDWQITSTGTASGKITMYGGTFTVNNNLVRGAANGTGTSYSELVVSGGTMNVGGDLMVDTVSVGYNGRTGLITVDGDAQIGSGTETLIIGRRNSGSGPTTNGTLDLSGANSTDINVGNLYLGMQSTSNDTVNGTLTLSTTGANTLTADTIRLGYIDGGNVGSTVGNIHFGGAANNVSVDTFRVGNEKAVGHVDIVAGGVLTLGGKSVAEADLLIGDNANPGTGTTPSPSTFDISGASAASMLTLDELVVGRYEGTGAGGGRGEFTMDAGTVIANSIELATSNGSNPGNTFGTINLNGGTLRAGTIEHNTVGSTATFNFTGGRLAVDSMNFTLDQDGGILAPGNSPGLTAIDGDYNLNAGSIEIEIDGLTPGTGYDRVTVTGTATLASASVVDVLLGYSPGSSSYDVLIADEIIDNSVVVNLPGAMWSYSIIDNFDGFNDVLRLSFVVPEPGTLMLLMPMLMASVRRRRAVRAAV